MPRTLKIFIADPNKMKGVLLTKFPAQFKQSSYESNLSFYFSATGMRFFLNV